MATRTRAARELKSASAPPSHFREEPPEMLEDRRQPGPDRLAQGLAWFSVGLGLAELTAPRAVAGLAGIHNVRNPGAIRMFGLREIASGVGIITDPQPAKWLWARVAGDVMDIAALGSAGRDDHVDRRRLTAAALAVLGVAALDIVAAKSMSKGATPFRSAAPTRVAVRKSITIARPPSEVYAFWHDLENLPRFMEHLESVRVIDDRTSHWKAKAPAGSSVEWDAEITEERPGELIGWRSLPEADVPNTGKVRFAAAPGDQGTEIHVELSYDPPGGPVGAAIARLFGEEPGQQVASDLRRLKQILETGEVVHSDASIARGPHPARPDGVRQGA